MPQLKPLPRLRLYVFILLHIFMCQDDLFENLGTAETWFYAEDIHSSILESYIFFHLRSHLVAWTN